MYMLRSNSSDKLWALDKSQTETGFHLYREVNNATCHTAEGTTDRKYSSGLCSLH